MYVQFGPSFFGTFIVVATLFMMGWVTYVAVKLAIKHALAELGITQNTWQRTLDRVRRDTDPAL